MRAWAGLVLVSLLLAGCVGGTADTDEGTDWPTITDPADLSYDGTSGFHIHDYWGGEEVLPLVERTKSHYFQNCAGGDSSWRSSFYPGDGQVVPQGTAVLSVTVSWEETDPTYGTHSMTAARCGQPQAALSNAYDAMELWIKPADASEVRLVEDDLTNGATVEIPLEYEEADLPHQLISAWEFQVRIRGSDDMNYNHFEGSVTVQAEVHRGLELRPFPPHPDHWDGRTELPLLDHEDRFQRFNIPYMGFNGYQLQVLRPPNGTVVPLDARTVEVTLTFDNEEPVGDLYLFFHAADTREFVRLEPDEASEGDKRFSLPVTEPMADTPYAKASQWAFYVNSPEDNPEEDAPTFDGTYRVKATVHKG